MFTSVTFLLGGFWAWFATGFVALGQKTPHQDSLMGRVDTALFF